MGTRWVVTVAWLAAGCSEPLLNNAPQPPAGAVAGAAGAVAAAAALADPEAAGKRAEEARKKQDEAGAPPSRGLPVRETVPAAVLDRLERAPSVDAGVGQGVGAGAAGAAEAGAGGAADAGGDEAHAPVK
jgi:hypothetical protein